MEHLSKEQIEFLKNLLLQRKREVLQRLKTFHESESSKVSTEVGDEIDHADWEMERFNQFRLRERETLYLKKVEYALKKIEAGTYGICENCGRPISFERLKARPVAIYCIECKKILEQQED
jgi:DnaK suppressor protein